MKKNILFVLVFLPFITFCQREEYKCMQNNFPKYKIDLSINEDWMLEKLIDSSFYITLETTDSNLLGRISKISIDSIIGISDGLSHSLHLYSMQGNFLNCIDKIGNAPGEYVQLSDFALSVKDQRVDILDAMQKKIINYSWTGEVKGEVKLPFDVGVTIFSILDSTYIFDQQVRRNSKEWKYSIVTLSNNGKLIKKMFPYSSYADIIFSARNTLMKVNDTLVYLPTYNDTLFSIIGDSILPRFKLEFGDKWIKDEYVYDKSKNPMSFINGLKDTDFIYFLNVLETKSHIWVSYVYKGESYNTLINKLSSKVSTYRKKNIENNCGETWDVPLTTWNNYFVIPIQPNYVNRTNVGYLKTDDNPCLLFVKIK